MIIRGESFARRLLGRLRSPSAARSAHTVDRATASHVEWLSALPDDLNIALVALDSAGHHAVVNNAAAEMLGLAPGRVPTSDFTAVLKGLAERALNHSKVSKLIDAVERDPATAFTSTWVFAESPTYLGVASRPASYPGFNGRIWAFYDNSGVAQAVEDDRQADALIRASSDAMLDPQVILEAVVRDGRVVDFVHRDINRAGCAFFGMSRERFIGQSLLDKGLLDVYARCAQSGEPVILDASPYNAEYLDESRFYDVRGTRVRPGMIVVTWRDVTDRIEAAERIAASEERYRLLTQNIGDIVIRVTDDGVVTWVSDSAEPALGFPTDYWLGRNVVDFALPDDREAARRRWAEIAEGKSFIGRRRLHDIKGVLHWIHLRSEPFYDSDGNREGLVASFRIIDDEVAAEEAAREEIARRDERNRKLTEYLETQTARMMSEMNSAARYVESILPVDLDGPVTVTTRYLPAEELGGDTYDFRWVDHDHLLIYLVDVSGHGVGPALLSVSVHNLLRSGTINGEALLQPATVLTELNRLFQMERHGGNYFTIWYGVYQMSTRTLRFASAGHPPALVIAGAAPEQLTTDSMPVGILEDTVFHTRSYVVPRSAEILLYSDGALELGMPWGRQRTLNEFSRVFAESAGKPEWTLNSIIVTLQERSGPPVVTDDSTFVLLNIP